jgi:hypothetical protein
VIDRNRPNPLSDQEQRIYAAAARRYRNALRELKLARRELIDAVYEVGYDRDHLLIRRIEGRGVEQRLPLPATQKQLVSWTGWTSRQVSNWLMLQKRRGLVDNFGPRRHYIYYYVEDGPPDAELARRDAADAIIPGATEGGDPDVDRGSDDADDLSSLGAE